MDSGRSSDTSAEESFLSEDDVSDVFLTSPRFSTAASTSSVPSRDFLFPFTPYNIQKEFMSHLYLALDEGKIGIFESPTGTGKSLSLICGAITWLRDFEEKKKKEAQAILDKSSALDSSCDSTLNDTLQLLVASTPTEPNEPDWFLEFDKKKALGEKAQKIKQDQERNMKRDQKLKEMKNDIRQRMQFKRKRKSTTVDDVGMKPTHDENANTVAGGKSDTTPVTDDDNLVVDEYHSDEEITMFETEDEEEVDMEQPHVTKIYYCSRTHSQLSQFVHEIQKSPFGSDSKVVTLGSRQNLCINDAVKKLSSLSMMNERCLELQKNKKKEPKKVEQTQPKKRAKVNKSGCPFYSASRFENFRDYVSVDVMDIEQLVETGKEMKSCPYYGTRLAIPEAQVVVLPYNTLLHKSTRQACGIKIEGNVVIIDEAHNLTETIANMYSVEVTGSQFCRAYSQLSQYMEKFKSRLKAKNLMYIKQILQILGRCIKALGGKTNAPAEEQQLGPSNSKLYTINDFLFSTEIDNINMFKIRKYCEKSMISKKLNGYVEKYQPSVKTAEPDVEKTSAMTKFLNQISQKNEKKENNKNEQPIPEMAEKEQQHVMSSPLQHIEAFLLALTNADKDGRVVIHKQDLLSQSSIKFLLLNPAVHFNEVVKEARSVIVAGGTMQPVDEFKHQLFSSAGVTPDRILEFSCGHVIAPENLLAIAMAHGPSGLQMDFTYQSRDLPRTMDELGRILTNTSNVVPGGLVCFFPSYDYEKVVYSHWEKTGVISRLQNRKQIFREPRKASQVDQVLGQYSACIEKACSEGSKLSVNGAILFCVVGGKMSEGINFSDNLGRCIVMIGLPFANIKSPELKEKMDYLDATMPAINGRRPGQVHYENLCMKAVNQSIGRAIRHKGDYATILLVDHRYARQSIQDKLPGWIVQRLQTANRFGPAFASTSKFFVDKRPKLPV
ncbi:ATP-dependent DNA helicase DDX11-like [Antedon mediterranea]|uniref:ATP-dependent DNA helicase DDX11-like n=1 Tax=Antedon mediterranea TaxID=105859 RepID=UPI003AF6A809